MDNPHKIKPRDKLTLDEVMERYLDWNQWNREHGRQAPSVFCDSDLHKSHLCCADHMAYSAEYGAFFRYFFHYTYDRMVGNGAGFSPHSMKVFCREHGVRINTMKAAQFHCVTVGEWLEYMPD